MAIFRAKNTLLRERLSFFEILFSLIDPFGSKRVIIVIIVVYRGSTPNHTSASL